VGLISSKGQLNSYGVVVSILYCMQDNKSYKMAQSCMVVLLLLAMSTVSWSLDNGQSLVSTLLTIIHISSTKHSLT